MAGSARSSKSAAAPATAEPATAPASKSRQPRQPEKKIGPFAGGVGVAIWLNQVEGQDGTIRSFRSYVAKSVMWLWTCMRRVLPNLAEVQMPHKCEASCGHKSEFDRCDDDMTDAL